MIDARGVLPEMLAVPVQSAIVFEVVHANLEAGGAKLRAQFRRNPLFAFGDEVERRAEA